jgi:hypothetical protein
MFTKEAVVFWQQCHWVQKLQEFLLLQRGSIMLNFSETNLLKRFMPIVMIFLLLFAYKSKIAKAYGYDCLNCKHQPNVCKFLLSLEAQILDNCFLIWCRKMRIKNIQHSLRILEFALRSTPSLHFISISSFFQCYLFYAYWCKKSYFINHSSCIYHPFIQRIIDLFM